MNPFPGCAHFFSSTYSTSWVHNDTSTNCTSAAQHPRAEAKGIFFSLHFPEEQLVVCLEAGREELAQSTGASSRIPDPRARAPHPMGRTGATERKLERTKPSDTNRLQKRKEIDPRKAKTEKRGNEETSFSPSA